MRIEQPSRVAGDGLAQAVAELEAAPSFPAAYAARVRSAVRRLGVL